MRQDQNGSNDLTKDFRLVIVGAGSQWTINKKRNLKFKKKVFVKYVQFAEIENKLVKLNSKIIKAYEKNSYKIEYIIDW